MRRMVSASWFVTQTAPSPYATPAAPKPTVMGMFTWACAGSILYIVSLWLAVTHTKPPPTARPVGVFAPGNARAGDAVLAPGSIRCRVASSEFATQTPPVPAAIGIGVVPTGTAPSTVPADGSILTTVFTRGETRGPDDRPLTTSATATAI